MSATLEQEELAAPGVQLGLEDRCPDALKMPGVGVVWVFLLGALFWVQSYQKIHVTDVWGHLSYGQQIWQTRTLPVTEPIMPLASGVPFIDTAWGSQVLAYLAEARFGGPALQFLHAASMTAMIALLVWCWQKRTGRFWITLLGTIAFLAICWQQFMVTRPQLAGMVCFSGLLVLLSTRWRTAHWVAIPALMLAWTNLHGSFIVGILLLACLCVGRAIDLLIKTGRPASWLQDRPLRRLIVVFQLAVLATLINPYGLVLYYEVLPFAENPNLLDLSEWQPLYARSYQGMMVLGSLVVLAFLYRQTPRRVSAMEVLTLLLFAGLTLWSARMIVWFAPLASMALVWHLHAIVQQRQSAAKTIAARDRQDEELETVPKRRGLWSVVAVGMVWIFFAYTPFGLRTIYGNRIPLKPVTAVTTPTGAAAYLVKYPPKGQIFNTYEWGDYLYWAGPKGLKIFVNSHADRVPADVWRHYMAISNVSSGWEDYLDLYSVNTIVVDKAERGSLIGRLRDHEKWNRVYEDNMAIIYTRKQPI